MSQQRSIWRNLCLLARLSRARRALLIETALALACARLLLAFAPFSKVADHLGISAQPPTHCSKRLAQVPTPQMRRTATEISRALRSAERHLPFEVACLAKAVAGCILLNRRGITSVLYLGAATDVVPGSALSAHAWLRAAEVEVTGYPGAYEFVEIARFVRNPPSCDTR
jgi:hypothetical protein